AFTAMSAAIAEVAVTANTAAARTSFFMTIPIFISRTVGLRCPKESEDRLRPKISGANLERAIRAVKQKTQATAAFLGVLRFLRDVVGGCCFRTTILDDLRVRPSA